MRRRKIIYNIIAVNPGWRYLAIAVFDCSGLREWRIKCLDGKDLKERIEKVRDIFLELLERYEFEALAIKKLHPSRSSPNLADLTKYIQSFFHAKKLRIFSYPLKELENAFSNGERINKKKLIELLADRYPELKPQMEKDAINEIPYFSRLFEAVALGHVCKKEICDNS